MMELSGPVGVTRRPITVGQTAQASQSIGMFGPEHLAAGCQNFSEQLDGLGVITSGIVAVGQAALAPEGGGMMGPKALTFSGDVGLEQGQSLLEPPGGTVGMGQSVAQANALAVADSQLRLQIFQIGCQAFYFVLTGFVVAPIHICFKYTNLLQRVLSVGRHPQL